jgi:hypothetical protein
MPKPWEVDWGQQGVVVPRRPKPGEQYEEPRAAADLARVQQGLVDNQARLEMERERLRIAQQEAALRQQAEQLKADAARKEAEARNPLNPAQLQSVNEGAWRNLQRIGRINKNHKEAWGPTIGMGSDFMRSIGGTNANNIATDLGGLQKANALTEIMKITQATGKNPFTPMSNTDVDTIAQSLGSASLDQTPKGFFESLDDYKQAAIKAYAGSAGMLRLNEEIERHNLSPEERERALRLYNANPRVKNIGRRSSGPPASAPRKGQSGGAKFLGFE